LPVPAVDARLVAPEAGFEIIDGRIDPVLPADEPRGTRHSEIAALLEAHVARGYDVAVDMLTRTSVTSDRAPDASVFPKERDPVEELAFEVVSTETLKDAAVKARDLAARGVRRILAVDVARKRALAWSVKTNAWEILPSSGVIEDASLAVPLPIAALVGAASADDAIARALLARKHPVLEDALRDREERGENRGQVKAKVDAILRILSARDIPVGKTAERRIRKATDVRLLDGWIAPAATCRAVDELFET
jgi:hypothetical protein